MDPPPPPAAAESIDSPPKRPHSSHDDSRVGGGGKLRLMCSYGGHIIPRPHDKSLCYVGGETRIVVVDRNSATVASLSARLSRSLSLNGRSFTLKYQLPNEDLDSLVSVSSDEDLDNMIDEYDRIAAVAAGGGARIRLFVFFNKPATAASMGSIRSESWFLDSLNSGSPSGSESGFLLLPRNLSDTALVTGIVGDHHQHGHYRNQGHQDSLILVESFTTSAAVTESPPPPSFGSTSPPEMGNNLLNLLPPILVREAADSVGGNNQEQQFQFGYRNQQQLVGSAQIQLENISITATAPNSFSSSSSSAVPPPPPPASITPTGSSENLNRMSPEDEEETRSDHGRSGPVGYRKPPLPLPHQHNNKVVSPVNNSYNPPPSPDSVVSDSNSIASSMVSSSSLAKNNGHNISGELSKQIETSNNGDPSSNVISTISNVPIPIQDPFFDQHQHLHQHQQQVHYLKPGPGGGQQVISSSYYALPPPSPNHHHHQQPYPAQAVYVMPMPMPQLHNHQQPPIYPTKNSAARPSGGKAAELGVVYSTNHHQQLYHLHHQQQFHPQQQYQGYSHLQHQPNGGGYEYSAPPSPDDQQHQMFHAQHQGIIGTNVMPPTPTPNHHQHQNQHHHHHQLGLAASDGAGGPHQHQHQQIEGASQRLQ